MAVSRTRQEEIHTRGAGIDDTLAPTDHDANAVDLADTLDFVASQLANILGETNWFDAPDKSIATLAAQATLEATLAETEKYWLTDVTVPNGQNWKVLSVAGSELPAIAKAIATGQKGLVSATAGTFGANDLAELAGDTTINPRNMLQVVDGATGDPILTSTGKTVWGLLQNESGATDGAVFTDTTPERAQVSFVVVNATNDDLVACPVADVEDLILNLSFVYRKALSERTAQDWMRRGSFVDVPSGAASVTLDTAVDNQGATPVTQTTHDINWRITDTYGFKLQNSDGSRDLLAVLPNAAGDEVELNVDTLDVNVGVAGVIDFDNGVTVDSGGQSVNLGVTAGQIDSTTLKLAAATGLAELEGVGVTIDALAGVGGPLTLDGTYLDADFSGDADSHMIVDPNSATLRTLVLAARNSGAALADLKLEADGELYLETVRQTTAIPLDDAAAGAISALAGGPHASVSAAIKYALEHGGVDLSFDIYVSAGSFAQGVNIPAVTLDLTAFSGDMGTPGSPGTPTLFLFLNGRLLRGAAASGTGDWYPGTTPANGDIKVDFPKGIKNTDVILTLAFTQ
jgi:hypothetical protein